MRVDRRNRVLLTLFAVLLFAVGVAVILAGTDVYGENVHRQRLLDNPVARFVGDNGDWLWPLAAFVAVVLALLSVGWLTSVVRTEPRQRHITLPGDGQLGRTVLDTGALRTAVEEEVAGFPDVNDADVRVSGTAQRPRLVLRVTADPDADIAVLRQRLETIAVGHARQALGQPDLPVVIDLGYSAHRRPPRLSADHTTDVTGLTTSRADAGA
ncbi:alkaline shock response membrane anchor protein AmaP [Micromonospora sp. NPDC049366]|uniref:alkaline shock response membrane anchor protein AmaP n=1 Tax=Micromonospora sp. NPDC049366 TaxID=3364271 RepID=UPI0037BD7F60